MPMVFFEGDPQKGEIADNAFKMLFALGTKMIDAFGGSPSDAITGGFLTVQKPQRVPSQPLLAIGAQARQMLRIIPLQPLQVIGAAQLAANAVQQKG